MGIFAIYSTFTWWYVDNEERSKCTMYVVHMSIGLAGTNPKGK